MLNWLDLPLVWVAPWPEVKDEVETAEEVERVCPWPWWRGARRCLEGLEGADEIDCTAKLPRPPGKEKRAA